MIFAGIFVAVFSFVSYFGFHYFEKVTTITEQCIISEEAAMYLFTGLVTDTDRFLLDSRKETLKMAGYLISLGVDFQSIYDELYAQDKNRLEYKAFIYNHVKYDGKVCY